MDVFSKKKRSEIMSKIRSKDTKAELAVFRELRKRGIYFQKHYRKAFGCPDIALPSKKKAVFIDGDFWHGYQFSKFKHRLPKKYWVEKIENNIKRDRRNKAKLRRAGWKILRIWEHEVNENLEKSTGRIIMFMKDTYDRNSK
jgi:DNA mismatch endonuclease (patch repair protein)